MKKINKLILGEIKKFKTIYIVRHIGPDPDALCTQLALRDSIKLTYPSKEVYALGASVAKFKSFGKIDKLVTFDKDALVISVDVPDKKRVDGLNIDDFKNVIKIDHHPFVEKFGTIELIETKTTSASQVILEFLKDTKLKINESVAKNLFIGIVADSNRFMFYPTDGKVLSLVSELVIKYKLNIQELYSSLYQRPLSEVRLMGYIASNLKVTKNKFAYIELDEDIIKSFNGDMASASNMINDFNNINEIVVWMFISNDVKNGIYKMNIRSRGPIVNDLATKYNGGGHRMASGIRTTDKKIIEDIIKDYDDLCKEYNKSKE